MLAPGPADPPDPRQLAALARDRGARPHVVGQTADVLPAMLSGAYTIGMAESTSARPDLAAQVTEALAGLGPLIVTNRRVSTDVVAAPARRPLQRRPRLARPPTQPPAPRRSPP